MSALFRFGSVLLLLAGGCTSDPADDTTTTGSSSSGSGSGGSGAASSGSSGGGGEGAGSGGGGGSVGGVEAFVAVGFGGRRVLSCDGGRTWVADQQVADEAEDDWHRTYSPKHLAYGDGTFVFLSGWGTPSTAWVSTDGAQWDEVSINDNGYSAIAYADGAFVALDLYGYARSTDGGRTWQDQTLAGPPLNIARTGTAYDGERWALGADGAAFVRDGANWIEVPGCQGSRHGHLGFEGGFVAGGGRLLSLGHDGDTCGIDLATGSGITPGHAGVSPSARPIYAHGEFVVAGGNQIATSSDGEQWTTQTLPSGVTIDLIARGESGTWVGANADGDSFYFSEDGVTWEQGVSSPGNTLLYMATGTLEACGP